MSLKTAIANKQNPEPQRSLYRGISELRELVIKKMRPGAKKQSIEDKLDDLRFDTAKLNDNDWWIEGDRLEAEDMKCEFLRDRAGK